MEASTPMTGKTPKRLWTRKWTVAALLGLWLVGLVGLGQEPSALERYRLKVISAKANTETKSGTVSLQSCPTSSISCPVNISATMVQSACGVLGSNGDYYSFDGVVGQTVTIDMVSTAFEVELLMLTPYGGVATPNVLSFLALNGVSHDQIIFTLPSPGTYIIQAESLWSPPSPYPATGPYTLSVTGCTGSQPSSTGFSGRVTDAATGVGLSGASVTWGSSSTTTDGAGNYNLNSLPCQTNALTVSKSGYQTFSQSYTPTCNTTSNVRNVTLTASPSSLPNLAPYQPPGWSAKIVVSKTTGTNSDSSPLAPTDSLYVDWAVVNKGTSATAAQFFTQLYVDGGLRQTWHTDPPLNANSATVVLDYAIGSLSAGSHTLRIRTDSTNAIAESDEADNEYTKTITVGSSPAAFVIPVVGSAPGSFGSFFRTGVQVLNAGGAAVSGRFIYHPAGVSGTSTDPGLDFDIPQGATLSYADLVQAMGQTGLGSLDVVVPANGTIAIVTRVFNDAGTGGTSGFTEAAAGVCNSFPCPPGSPRSASVGTTGYFIAPADPAHFRFNIGVRTLELGAALRFDVYDASGRLVQSVSKAYGPNYFIQQSAEVFLGLPLPANYSVVISLTSGSAIVYGATIDNTTNDSSIQITGVLAPAALG